MRSFSALCFSGRILYSQVVILMPVRCNRLKFCGVSSSFGPREGLQLVVRSSSTFPVLFSSAPLSAPSLNLYSKSNHSFNYSATERASVRIWALQARYVLTVFFPFPFSGPFVLSVGLFVSISFFRYNRFSAVLIDGLFGCSHRSRELYDRSAV